MSNGINSISGAASNSSQIAQMNRNFARLDREAVVKQFNGNSGEALTIGQTGNNTLGMKVTQNSITTMTIGKYDNTHYGLIFYDATGVPVQLIGQAPDDGRVGSWIARPGQNVITLLGG